jgi:hypothetical protein
MLAGEAARLRKQGLKNNHIARKLFPEDYAHSREKTTRFIRDLLSDYKRMKRPKPKWPLEPKKIEESLKTLIGSDPEKWTAVQTTLNALLDGARSWPEDPTTPDVPKSQIEHYIHVFLREEPGRPRDPENERDYAEAARMRGECLTNAQITKELFPEDYNDPISRQSATDRVRNGIERHLKRQVKKSSKG